ncbi:HNH endonuclease signature motif containing protein [Nocardia sp. NPDC058640]|uniref:HNH endonuclease signature motif containing protein n=1 Tax=Nocardia sp. NPDC058640 TaxID=3346571 RepID=UPI0036577E39
MTGEESAHDHFGSSRLPPRFWRKVQRDAATGCWRWVAAKSTTGYGKFALVAVSPGYAHRISYIELVGPVPEGLVLDHLCRNRLCVNPAHLEPVRQRINVLRGESPVAANVHKTFCANGHPYDEKNTYRRPGADKRGCRLCRRAAYQRWVQNKASGHHPMREEGRAA